MSSYYADGKLEDTEHGKTESGGFQNFDEGTRLSQF